MTNTKTNIISSYVAISSKYECLVRVFISGRKKEGILIKMKRRLSNTPKFEPQIPIENDNIDLDTSPVREMINTYEHNIIQKKEEPIQQPKRFSFTKKSPKPQQSCQCAHLKLPPLILPGNLLYCSKINTLEILAPPANNNINFLAIKNKTIYWIESSNISESWFI
jgi:hypothetical protein